MDVNEIRQYLPHRFPMLLVDRILECDAEHIVGIKNVTANEPFFSGHFPDFPVMPGVLIVEAMAQTAGVLVLKSVEDRDKKLVLLVSIEYAKFRKQVVPGGFKLNGSRAGFTLGEYDRSRPIVIDPAIINYSSYLGGESNDRGHDIVGDADGNAYVVGWTQSEDFPEKNAYQPGLNNDSDEAFITKFNPDGSALIWSTYLGGSGQNIEVLMGDGAYGVALDADRNVYVTGYTFSFDFPVRNAMQTHISDIGFSDSFITKLNAAGNAILYSSFLGGSGSEFGHAVAVDALGNAYVTGETVSTNFPTAIGAYQTINGCPPGSICPSFSSRDGFVSKISFDGVTTTTLAYSTYLGGGSDEVGRG